MKNIQDSMQIKHVLKFAMAVFAFIMIIGCSDDSSEKKASIDNTEHYEMLYAKDKTAQITLQRTQNQAKEVAGQGMGLLIQKTQDKQSLLKDNAIKIIAFFPKDCSVCMPTLIHLSNLLNRNKSLQVIVISDHALHMSAYKDFPVSLNPQIINLVDVNKKFGLLLDSIKRALNIEIRDYKDPIFLIQDKHNVILQSIEGAVLEEVFDITISQILSQDDTEAKQVQPNNTLSQTAPASTPPIHTNATTANIDKTTENANIENKSLPPVKKINKNSAERGE